MQIGIDMASGPDQTAIIFYGQNFGAYNAAQRLLVSAGFSIGQSCAASPTACMFGDYDWIAKWRNLTARERAESHAILRGDHRVGPISIALTDHCPAEGRKRFFDAASELEGIA